MPHSCGSLMLPTLVSHRAGAYRSLIYIVPHNERIWPLKSETKSEYLIKPISGYVRMYLCTYYPVIKDFAINVKINLVV